MFLYSLECMQCLLLYSILLDSNFMILSRFIFLAIKVLPVSLAELLQAGEWPLKVLQA